MQGTIIHYAICHYFSFFIEELMTTYFINRRGGASEPFTIVYREVKTRTRKGYPITYELKALPGEYDTWEEALQNAQRLNSDAPQKWGAGSLCPPSPL
jgi:hypothetical protein